MNTGFVDMSVRECRDRIAGGGVGRVVFCTYGEPRIYPVNFIVVDDAIVFRTSPYTDLGTLIGGKLVAFEVDEINYATQRGWSVVVSGGATVVDDPDEVNRLHRLGPEPWASGQRPLFVRVRPRTMSGRHVRRDA